jgi:hypothetical protein
MREEGREGRKGGKEGRKEGKESRDVGMGNLYLNRRRIGVHERLSDLHASNEVHDRGFDLKLQKCETGCC